MKKAKWMTIIIIVIIIAIIVLQNIQPISINILFFSLDISKALLLLITAIIFFVIGALVTFFVTRKKI